MAWAGRRAGPKLLGVPTRPRPKCSCQTRLTKNSGQTADRPCWRWASASFQPAAAFLGNAAGSAPASTCMEIAAARPIARLRRVAAKWRTCKSVEPIFRPRRALCGQTAAGAFLFAAPSDRSASDRKSFAPWLPAFFFFQAHHRASGKTPLSAEQCRQAKSVFCLLGLAVGALGERRPARIFENSSAIFANPRRRVD